MTRERKSVARATPMCGNCAHAGSPVVVSSAARGYRVKCAEENQRARGFGDYGAWKDGRGYCPFHRFAQGDAT